MPIYEYHCNECGKEFEKLMRFSDPNINGPQCPDCSSHETHRQVSRVAAFSASNAGSAGCGPTSSGFR